MTKKNRDYLRQRLALAEEQKQDICPVCTDPACLVRAGSIAATEHWKDWHGRRTLED
jgi:hypothetical protein